MPSTNETTIRRFHDEVLSQSRNEVLDDLLDPDAVVITSGGNAIRGRDQVKPFVMSFPGAFTDFKVDIVNLIEQGDQIAARCESSGTHTGEFMGIPPTNRTITKVVNQVQFTMKDGKIREAYLLFDDGELMRQLGLTQAQPSVQDA
jgi:steroid delta-isomerase-like uncharacterized protein